MLLPRHQQNLLVKVESAASAASVADEADGGERLLGVKKVR